MGNADQISKMNSRSIDYKDNIVKIRFCSVSENFKKFACKGLCIYEKTCSYAHALHDSMPPGMK
jgi:hypothetical protein